MRLTASRRSGEARALLCFSSMTLKKLFVLGSVLTGAVLLRDKNRRDRLMSSASNWFDNLRSRTRDLMSERAGSAGTSTGASSTFGAGATTRGMSDVGVGTTTPPRGNGLY